MSRIIIIIGLLLSGGLATPVADIRPHGSCKQLNVSITASAAGAVYDISKVNNDIDATAWAVNADTWSNKPFPEKVLQNTTISGTYSIHVQLCTSKIGSGDVLQIATHGAFYDSRYWDAKLEGHSWVNASLAAGYSVLTYDRLGTGQSDKPDAYTVVQAKLELEILRQLTLKARSGSFSAPPRKVVHVGHSFGSIMTTAFIATYPALSDGAIITGFVFSPHLGAVGRSSWSVIHAAGWPSGYVVMQKSGVQSTFFEGAFTADLLAYGNAIKSPSAVAEITSGASLVTASGPFKGPIQYMLPELDFFICAGNCNGVANLTVLHGVYPNASAIEVAIQPDTGHALPLHKNATAGFQVSFDFLMRHGLGPK